MIRHILAPGKHSSGHLSRAGAPVLPPIDPSTRSTGKKAICRPVIAPLIQDRRVGLMVAALTGLHLGLTAWGGFGWRCPIHFHLGIPCPGCGLSSAMLLCLSGQWSAGLTTHLFAPLVLLLGIAAAVHGCLPERRHRCWTRRCAEIEEKTAVVPALAAGMLIYWASRLIVATHF